MAAPAQHLLRHLSRLSGRPVLEEGDTDAALLGRFIRYRDEAAFARLVARHGAMVLGACRRVLHDAHAADDAYQATWLVLARKAAAVRPAEALEHGCPGPPGTWRTPASAPRVGGAGARRTPPRPPPPRRTWLRSKSLLPGQ